MRLPQRLLYALKKHGGKAVVHGLRGKPSPRRIEEEVEKEAARILSADVSKGFGERYLPVSLCAGPQPG